jgi:alanyl-tRNA synthetase
MKADELRESYLTFFEGKGCVRRPSDVLVPRNDPTVLFTPAGMNQFKDHFLGRVKLEFTRATTCQKCLRTGDIDNVGRTPHHHTFFEMLGNFSFGDYFKREAILWAWEFLTDKKWLGIDPERISASVFYEDHEAAEIWLKEVGLPPEKLAYLGEDENFWPANAPTEGPDGVCGPCSEIFVQTPFGKVEVWNLVFTQYNRVGPPPNNLRPLPSKNIDTGMGLERMAAVLQGVDSNFHIDILRPLVEAAAEACHIRYDPADDTGRRLRRIADHVRACTFAIHENVTPGPNKERYVIRRLIRRAVLDGYQMGVREPFLYLLPPKVVELMRNPYPELAETVDRVCRVIREEEENFLGTIEGGLDRIEKLFRQMLSEGRRMVSGPEAAYIFQTYGFPPELLENLAAERGLTFDWEGFRREMERHGDQSAAGRKVEVFKTGPLDSLKKAFHATQFVGYSQLECRASVVGIISGERLLESWSSEDQKQAPSVTVVLDRSPFYGEKGGQVGDTGWILGDGVKLEVLDTQVEDDFLLHQCRLVEGSLRLGMEVKAQVDAERRQGIRRAHTATHLLHFALRKILGPHALQEGSKVDQDLLRFDFSHPGALSDAELLAIEDEVNRRILACDPVAAEEMPLTEARRLGATMLFGEKYGDLVRVIRVGDYSMELCGGTHLDNTGQIGIFRIVDESSISAGTRRVVAITGLRALEEFRKVTGLLERTANLLRVRTEDIPGRVDSLLKELRQLKKVAEAGGAASAVTAEALLAKAQTIEGAKLVVAELAEPNIPLMRQLIDQIRRKGGPAGIFLAAADPEEKKVTLVAGLTRDLVDRGLDARDWARSVAGLLGGGGGGRPDLAEAGGKHPGKLPEALEAAAEWFRSRWPASVAGKS